MVQPVAIKSEDGSTATSVLLHIQQAVASMCQAANASEFNDANMTANYAGIVDHLTKKANQDLEDISAYTEAQTDEDEDDPQFSKSNMYYQQAQQTWSGYQNTANSDVQLANEMVSTSSSRQQDVLKLGNEVSAVMVYVSGLVQGSY